MAPRIEPFAIHQIPNFETRLIIRGNFRHIAEVMQPENAFLF